MLPPSEMGGDELLRSVARFQRDMLRKREEQEVKMLSKEPKSLKDKGAHSGATLKLPTQAGKILFYIFFVVFVRVVKFVYYVEILQP